MLNKKNILLITPILFHYHTALKEELEKMGANVLFFPDQPNDAFTALKRKIFPKISHTYYDKIYEKIKSENIDFFLLINGKGISRNFIEKLRVKNPEAKFITYQWDSIARNNLDRKTNYLYFLDLFDKKYSFDYQDVNSIKDLEYFPTFHTSTAQELTSENKEIDLLMVATYSDERYNFIVNNDVKFRKSNIAFHHHLHLPWHHYLRAVLLQGKKINRKFIQFSTINKNEMQQLYAKSNAVLDIPYANQTGFTMRIMEGLANNCRVFTTNKKIDQEGFYTPNNISVFSENNFCEAFEKSKDVSLQEAPKSVENLYVSNWIQHIFNH